MQDEIRALVFLLKNENAAGVYNLTAPDPLTQAEFGRITAQVLRRPYWFPTPAFAMRLALGEMSTLVLDGQRVTPDRLSRAGFIFNYDQLKPALQAILA
jgi:NAD dependent epimerase/dehydratase family enzyme